MSIRAISDETRRAARRDRRRAVLLSAVVVVLLLTPGNSMPDLPGRMPWWVGAFGDKVVHALLFFAETLALGRALRHHRPRHSQALAAGLALTFGLLTELAQLLVPFRDCSPGDLLADAFGIALALPWLARPSHPTSAAETSADFDRSAQSPLIPGHRDPTLPETSDS